MKKSIAIVIILISSSQAFAQLESEINLSRIDIRLEKDIESVINELQTKNIRHKQSNIRKVFAPVENNFWCGTYLGKSKPTLFPTKSAFLYQYIKTTEYWTPILGNYKKVNHWQITLSNTDTVIAFY